MSIIVIDRDFLNHDQTGSCESIVFIKGRKEEWMGCRFDFLLPPFFIVDYVFKF